MLLTLNASFITHQSFVLLQPRKKTKTLSTVMVAGMDSGGDNDDKGIAERLCPPRGGRRASHDYVRTRAITRRRRND